MPSQYPVNNLMKTSAHLFVGSVEGVGIVCLRTHHPGHLVDQPHVHAHLKALVEGIDVA